MQEATAAEEGTIISWRTRDGPTPIFLSCKLINTVAVPTFGPAIHVIIATSLFLLIQLPRGICWLVTGAKGFLKRILTNTYWCVFLRWQRVEGCMETDEANIGGARFVVGDLLLF